MSQDERRRMVLKLKSEGKSYAQIANIMGICRNNAINLYNYRPKLLLKKRGPKFTLQKYDKLKIKRQISFYQLNKEKVNSTKLKTDCNLSLSTRSIQRHMRRSGMHYRKVPSKIFLTKKHKQERVRLITKWIGENHQWERTIFSDEKRFSLDGSDCWKSYLTKSSSFYHQCRQCSGGCVMVWMKVMPNGLMTFSFIEGKFCSRDYIILLKNKPLPIMYLNYGMNYTFQQDNASVHNSKECKTFFDESNISILEWPAKSPDLNIVEDMWKKISNLVYDGPQYNSKADLRRSIKSAIDNLNTDNREYVLNLYASYRRRLCYVLEKRGELYNK
jgi:transposase